MSEVHGHICSPRIYEYNGWTFEYGPTTCWPLRKDGEPRARAGKGFYDRIDGFFKLDDEQKEAHRVGGGCRSF